MSIIIDHHQSLQFNPFFFIAAHCYGRKEYFTLSDLIQKEAERLEKQISNLEKRVDKSQQYVLACNKNRTSYRWNCKRIDHKESFELSKSEENKARKLAAATYNKYLLEDSIQEKKALDYYINHQGLAGGKSEAYLSNPEVCRLLKVKYRNLDAELAEWANTACSSHPQYPEDLTVRSASGLMVRSKSEAIIDMLLVQHNIPHRYEDEFMIGEITLRPDFTIRHPRTGEYFLWEHLGLMDNNDYCANAYNKMHLYATKGFYPFMNLIITSETADHPADVELINKIIEHFFA